MLYQQQRGMANLKAIAIRLKSVKNIQKITQSMKMVSAAKYARAERDLKAARPYGEGAQKFYDSAEVKVSYFKGPFGLRDSTLCYQAPHHFNHC